jgi:DNA-directed RNA polymerase beta subunit/intein/homing endonuclease
MPSENTIIKNMQGGKSTIISKQEKGGSKGKKEASRPQKNNDPDHVDFDNDENERLTTDEVFRLPDLHFNKQNYMFKHLYDSYNKFIEEDIKNFLEYGEHTFSEIITPSTCYRNSFKFENIRVDVPTFNNGVEPMFPSDARHNGLTYSIKLLADISQYCDVFDIASDHKFTNLVGHKVDNYHLCTIPLMVRSKWCSLTTNKDMDKTECKYDPGGYFIVKGNEKVIISQDRMVENKPLVFIKKDSGAMSYIVQVNSRSYRPHGMTQVMTVKMKKDGILTIRVPILNEVNVCAVFRALGLESDRDIINYITNDEYDNDMLDLIRISLDACKNDKGNKFSTQEEAIDFLIPKMRVIRKYTETDKETKLNQKKIHLKNLLLNNFLPHQEGGFHDKAHYLGYMVNRLLKVVLGRQQLDDRDSYVNKRVDLPGDLMYELFKQQYKKLMSECRHFFETRNKSNDTPINIISNIKPNIIEQGFKASLSTGHWIRRQGVAQMLQRLTYLQTISFLRRVDAPGGDASTAKLTSPRHLHPSSVGFLCVAGDSEILMGDNASVELIKNMRDGDKVMTVYEKDLREISSLITNTFYQMKTNMMEFVTISGRKLKCSKDHPVLTLTNSGTYKMVNAGELRIDDKVIVRHYEKYLPLDKETIVKLKEYDRDYFIDGLISQEKLELLSRLVGTLFSTGNLQKLSDSMYTINFYLDSDTDIYELYEDINKLGIHGSCYLKRTILNNSVKWLLTECGTLAKLIENLCKIVKIESGYNVIIPDWIINGNNRIKREFLSALNGTSDSNVSMYDDSAKIGLGLIGSVSRNDEDYCSKSMNTIKTMFEDFRIDGQIIYNKLGGTFHYKPTDDHDNVNKFVDVIGWRYSDSNKKRSSIPIEYLKYITNTSSENIITYDDFSKFVALNDDCLSLAVPIKSIQDIEPENAYDFTTKLNTHTFIANGIVLHNCPPQTPEHAKVGLTKHLSLIGSVSIMSRDQYSMLKDFLSKKVTCLADIPLLSFRDSDLYKVFLNGAWIGVTKKYLDLEREMTDMKLRGDFDQKNVSIVADHEEGEIRVYCDSGRMYRPTLRVKDNKILLTRDHIRSISLNKADKLKKVTDWDEFLIKYPGVVEYVDTELQPYAMIADKMKKVQIMRSKMQNSLTLDKSVTTRHVDNRYDDMFFLNYTHCEIHPCLLVGEIITNIPFFDRNAGPRSIFAYAQGRQAMGIYATNYRDRLDISFILYYPQKPLVSTRTAKYTNSEILPAGENATVAIACYGGLTYNPCHSTKLWQVGV